MLYYETNSEIKLRIFKNKVFTRFAKKSGLEDSALCTTVENAENGLIDADLGGGVIKQRIARKGSGKSGGFRTIILFKSGDKAFFVYGFAKNEIDNISTDDLLDFRRLATKMLIYDEEDLRKLLDSGFYKEVVYEN